MLSLAVNPLRDFSEQHTGLWGVMMISVVAAVMVGGLWPALSRRPIPPEVSMRRIVLTRSLLPSALAALAIAVFWAVTPAEVLLVIPVLCIFLFGLMICGALVLLDDVRHRH